MGRNIMTIFASLFGRRSSFEQEMLTYAKTEYKKDWQYAYHYMVAHGGKAPFIGGVTY